jgi:rhamnulokinase
MVQAIALGHIDTIDDARAIIANSFVLDEFEPKNQTAWDDAYLRLRQVMKQDAQLDL